MSGFKEHCGFLAELETFDPSAFRADTKQQQPVCDFVLALALLYNDFNNTMYAGYLLDQSRPESPLRPCREWGCYWGIRLHIIRLEIALVHELFELVRRSRKILEDDMLHSVLTHLPPGARAAWEAVVAIAQGGTPKDSLGRTLLLIRNTVSFHYDPKTISKGYVSHFFGPDRRDERAFVSRGPTMAQSRFYFADAAIQDRLERVGGSTEWEQLTSELPQVFDALNLALMGVIERFIQKRAGAYRKYDDQVA